MAISKHTEKYTKSIQSNYAVTLLPNAIDVKRFQKPTDFQKRTSHMSPKHQISTSSLKPQASDSVTTLNLINIGSFTENKNQQFLIDVLLKLNDLRINVKFYFLGEGELLEKVEKKAIQSGVQDQCHFLGNVENVEEYLWKSDVYVHAAKSEALGLTLIEAMASGLPVVTLDGGGNRDLMINGKTGYLIERQDPELFANRILEVYKNKEMGDFNAEYAKKFDIESYCDKLLTFYNHSHRA
jgi:glycosyltransferase EpsD